MKVALNAPRVAAVAAAVAAAAVTATIACPLRGLLCPLLFSHDVVKLFRITEICVVFLTRRMKKLATRLPFAEDYCANPVDEVFFNILDILQVRATTMNNLLL